MKYIIYVIAISLTLLSCDNSRVGKLRVFNQFDFSYNNTFTTCFSIKFTQGDTVFIKEHFASMADSLEDDNNYFAILSGKERQKLDSFLNKMKFETYDTSYFQSYEDGAYCQFYFANDTLQKVVFIHSDNVPAELKEFSNWIVATKKNLKNHLADRAIEFGSLEYFYPEGPPLRSN